jgi:hypothetical protein
LKRFAFASLALVVTAGTASAQDLIFNFHQSSLLSGDTPTGDLDGVVARLELTNSAENEVTFTLRNTSDPATSQFLTGVFLNLDPFISMTGSEFASPIQAITFSENGINAPAGNRFDVQIDLFENAAQRLNAGEFVSFSIMGDGLTAQNFDAFTLEGSLGAALRVQGIGPNAEGSAWLTASPVPEPTTLAGLGLASLAYLRRRKQR